MIQTAKDANMIKVVHKNTAKNPVARAVARAKLHSALIDQKICLYMMADGEECTGLMDGLATTLGVIGYAFEWQHLKHQEIVNASTDLKILRGGLSACKMMLISVRYATINTVAIANALDAAERMNKTLKPEAVQRAWLALCK